MNFNEPIVTNPFHQLPITLVNKAMIQKRYRNLHCMECGMPIAEITDKIVIAFDNETAMDSYLPDAFGFVEIHCPRKRCKQHYRMEFAL